MDDRALAAVAMSANRRLVHAPAIPATNRDNTTHIWGGAGMGQDGHKLLAKPEVEQKAQVCEMLAKESMNSNKSPWDGAALPAPTGSNTEPTREIMDRAILLARGAQQAQAKREQAKTEKAEAALQKEAMELHQLQLQQQLQKREHEANQAK